MHVPTRHPFHEVLDVAEVRHPGAIDSLLIVDHVRARVQFDGAAFADEGDAPPATRRTNGQLAAGGDAGAVDRDFAAEAVGRFTDTLDGVFVGLDNQIRETEPLGQGDPLLDDVNADHLGCASRASQHERGEAHGSETDDERRVVAGDADAPNGFVAGPEPAGNAGPVDVAHRIRHEHAVGFLGQAELGVSTVTLPAIGRSQGTRAADLIAGPALVAAAAAADMVQNDAVALLEAAHAGARGDDLAGWLMAANHARRIAFRTLAEVLAVDGSDVTAANRGSLHLDENLPVAGRRDWKLAELHGAVPRKYGSEHRLRHVSLPHRVEEWLSACNPC